MQVIDIDPYEKFFSQFHPNFHPIDKRITNHFYPFHQSSLKIEQYLYCFSRLINEIDDEQEEVQYSSEFETRVCTYLEGFLISVRSALDLAISGMLKIHGINNNMDSMSKFLNRLEKDTKYQELPLFDFFSELKTQLFSDEFSWSRALFSRASHRSLRDVIVHKQRIEFTMTYNVEDEQNIYVETKQRETHSGKNLLIVKDLKEFITDIKEGAENILSRIREDAYSIKDAL